MPVPSTKGSSFNPKALYSFPKSSVAGKDIQKATSDSIKRKEILVLGFFFLVYSAVEQNPVKEEGRFLVLVISLGRAATGVEKSWKQKSGSGGAEISPAGLLCSRSCCKAPPRLQEYRCHQDPSVEPVFKSCCANLWFSGESVGKESSVVNPSQTC